MTVRYSQGQYEHIIQYTTIRKRIVFCALKHLRVLSLFLPFLSFANKFTENQVPDQNIEQIKKLRFIFNVRKNEHILEHLS